MSELVTDFLGDLWSFDSRLWRSLLPLLVKPGQLTIDYLAGRRARYVPPFRMYLVLSLIFFVLMSLLGREIGVAVSEDEDRIAEELQKYPDVIRPQPFTVDPDQVGPESGVCIDLMSNLSGFLDTPERRQRLLDSCSAVLSDSGDSLQRALAENVPMMMFLFIPLMAFMLKLLYLRSGRKYVEHLLFFLHFHAFFFLLASLAILLDTAVIVAPALSAPVAFVNSTAYSVYLPVYLFVAMYRVYGPGMLATGGKYALLVIGYGMMMLISFLITLGYSAYNLQ